MAIAIIVIALGVFAAVSLNNVKSNNTTVNNTTTEVLNVTNVTPPDDAEKSSQQSSSNQARNQAATLHTTQRIMLIDGTSLKKLATAGHTPTLSLPRLVKTDIHIRECMIQIPVKVIGDICINMR